jgi:hypothetical protein
MKVGRRKRGGARIKARPPKEARRQKRPKKTKKDVNRLMKTKKDENRWSTNAPYKQSRLTKTD